MGSNPTSSAIISSVGVAVKHTRLSSVENIGSNPIRRTKYGPLAQLVEQETLNLFVESSNLSWFTKYSSVAQLVEHGAVNTRVVRSSRTGGAN